MIIRNGEAIIVTDIDGVPVEVGVRDGEFELEIDEEEARRRAIERAREQREAAEEQRMRDREAYEEEMRRRSEGVP